MRHITKGKIRLLVDARVLEGEGQGSATYLREVYRSMMKRYCSCYEFFFAGEKEEVIRSQFSDTTNLQFIQITTRNRWKLYALEFPRIIRKWKIDWAHFQYMAPFVKGCQYIVTTHDVLFMDFPDQFSWSYRVSRRFLFKQAFLKSDIKITVSEYSRQAIIQHFGVKEEEVFVTPNAVGSQFFEVHNKLAIRDELRKDFGIENFVLYVSRLEARKNHRLLVDAFEDLQLFRNYQLVFVGNNTLDDAGLQQLVDRALAKYPGRFHWFSHVGEPLLLQLYRGAQVFVYPSLAEGFGIPPLEAAACLLPTLCAKNTAMTDFTFLEDQLFDPTNRNKFYEKLKQLLSAPPEEEKLKAIAHQIREKYSWENSAKILHDAICQNKHSG